MAFTDDELNAVHEAIIELLDEPRSKTKARIVEAVTQRYDYREQAIKVHLSDLIHEGHVVEHPGIDYAWVLAEERG